MKKKGGTPIVEQQPEANRPIGHGKGFDPLAHQTGGHYTDILMQTEPHDNPADHSWVPSGPGQDNTREIAQAPRRKGKR